MKYLVLFAALSSTICFASEQKTQNKKTSSAKAPAAKSQPQQKSIQILGTTLELKEEKKLAKQYLGEYIPATETFDNFTKMFAVSE